MNQALAAVVLCAGKGTRMKSENAKVLHQVLGRPMAWYPLSRALELGAQNVVAVVGHQAESVKESLAKSFQSQPVSFAVQAQQRGTGDAVAAARTALTGFSGAVLILYGDVPLITTATLKRLVEAFHGSSATLAMISCKPDDPNGYGRVIRDASHRVTGIVEQKDATPAQLHVNEVNAGLYLADSKFLWGAL